MALITPDSRCAICRGKLDRPYTATAGPPMVCNPRLWAYCDAPLHWDCLIAWEKREEFSRAYFVSGLHTRWSGIGTLLKATPKWYLACGPAVPGQTPRFVEVSLAAWPFDLHCEWSQWDAYVAGGFRTRLPGPALDAAKAVMEEVRLEAPSLEVLRSRLARLAAWREKPLSYVEFGDYLVTLWGEEAHRTDWRALEQARQAQVAEQRAQAKALVRSNEIARKLAVQLVVEEGLTCPHCHRRTRQMRFYDLEPRCASYFVCSLCGRSFAGSEASNDS